MTNLYYYLFTFGFRSWTYDCVLQYTVKNLKCDNPYKIQEKQITLDEVKNYIDDLMEHYVVEGKSGKELLNYMNNADDDKYTLTIYEVSKEVFDKARNGDWSDVDIYNPTIRECVFVRSWLRDYLGVDE